MNPAEQAALAFCSALFAGADESLADHQVTVLTHPGPSVRWVQGLDPAAVASAVREADSEGGDGAAVYLSMSPLAPGAEHYTTGEGGRRKQRRGDVSDVSALLGVWADLDWISPAHTSDKRLPDDETAVRKILAAAGLTPTLLWRSGHGLQAFWGLAEAWVFADSDDPAAARTAAGELCRNWQLTLAYHAHHLGRWQIDMTADLTRVLRPAGTTNRKIRGDARRVEIIEENPNARYDPADIEARMAPQRVLDRLAGMSAIPAGSPVVEVDQHAVWAMCTSDEYKARGYVPEWLSIMLEEGMFRTDSRIVKIFRDGHDAGHSEADASLARHCAMLDLDARDAVEIIMCRHLRTGHKLEKVDPSLRKGGDYIIRTVGKVFEAERQKRAARAGRQQAADAALAAQDGRGGAPWTEPAGELPDPGSGPQRAPEPQPEDGPPSVGPVGMPEEHAVRVDPVADADNLGRAIVAELGDGTAAIREAPPVPDDERVDGPEIDDERSEQDEQADEDTADAPPADDDEPAGDDEATHPAGEPPPGDDEIPDDSGEQDGPADAPPAGTPSPEPGPDPEPADEPADPDDEPDEAPTAERPAIVRPVAGSGRGTWGSRTQPQHDELSALSADLLGRAAERVNIWRCQTRGRGSKAERRLQLRIDRSFRWPVSPPIGYVPGLPYSTGWWPAATFDTYGGWRTVLQQECLLLVQPWKAEDFQARYGRTLIRMWEPDDSGGSLENVTRDSMRSYLLDYPLFTEWTDAAAQGMPMIMQPEPRWRLDTPFTVLVRWADFGQHTRSHFGINTTPAILTEMAELAGARPARTLTQNGRWRSIRREYLTDDEWHDILVQGEIASQQREERHGLHVMRGGLYSDEETGGTAGQAGEAR